MKRFASSSLTTWARERSGLAPAFVVVALLIAGHQVGVLPSLEVARSALGKQATAPANADAIEKGLATMQGNWYWFLLGVLPLAFAVLIGAVGLGVSRSSEWLFKLVVSLVGVIAFAPAVVA